MSKMEFNKNQLKVLDGFSSDYEQKIHGRVLAKKLKMNQKTVANSLSSLEKQNILKSYVEGRNKYYYFNKKYSKIKKIIKLIELMKKL